MSCFCATLEYVLTKVTKMWCLHVGGVVWKRLTYSDSMAFISYCTEVWSPQYEGDIELLERIQRRATGMIQEMEHLSYRDRLIELGLLSMESRRF